MVRSGDEWRADQVLVGVEGDCRQETGAVIRDEERHMPGPRRRAKEGEGRVAGGEREGHGGEDGRAITPSLSSPLELVSATPKMEPEHVGECHVQ